MSEFLVFSPLMLFLLYSALFLNELLSQSMNLDLMTRNLSVAPLAMPVNTGDLVYKETIFPDTRVTLVNYPFKDSLPISATYGLIDSGERKLTQNLMPIVLSIKNTVGPRNSHLLEPDLLKEVVILNKRQGTSPIESALTMFNLSEQNTTAGRKFWSRFYFRYHDGFHPRNYQNQALIGYVLGRMNPGSSWSSPHKKRERLTSKNNRNNLGGGERSFIADCSMNFIADSRCQFQNWLATTQRVSYVAWGLLDFVPVVGQVKSNFSIAAKILYEQTSELISENLSREIVENLSRQSSHYISREIQNLPSSAFGDLSVLLDKELGAAASEPLREILR